MEEMVIIILPDGKIQIEASGYTGGKCTVELEKFEEYLKKKGYGIDGKEQKRKLEQMYSSAPGQTIQR